MNRLSCGVTMMAVLMAAPAMAQDASARCATTFDPATDYFPAKVSSEHSAFWDIEYHGNYKVVTVADGESETPGAELTYVLVQCGTPAPELTGELAGALVVEVPIERAVVTHRNALAMLDEIGAVPSIVGVTRNFLGFAETDPWYASVAERAAGFENVGSESEMDYEMTLALEADVIFMAGYGPGYQEVTTVSGRGLPAVMVSNRTEPTPLGSSEWLKLVSAFYNREAEANAVFSAIETDYSEIAQRVADQLDGKDYSAGYACLGDDGGCGFMYAHGAKALNGQILELMGVANPFAEGNDRPNGMDFDYETALERSQDADFFVIYYIDSPKALASDERYRNIPALADGNYVISTVPNYYECNAVTYVRVDRLVRDYAIGMLPELFPGEEGVCFKAP
jgi:iron complex transport system substrate-binding protein